MQQARIGQGKFDLVINIHNSKQERVPKERRQSKLYGRKGADVTWNNTGVRLRSTKIGAFGYAEVVERVIGNESNDIKKILVVGASGRTGKLVVEKLSEKDISIKALVREEAKGKKLLQDPSISKNVEVALGNVQDVESLRAAVKGCDAIINAAGAKDFFLDPLAPFYVEYEGVKNLIAAAKMAGVKKFVHVSSIAVDDRNPIVAFAFWGILFYKKRGEEEIQRSGIDYTIIRPGGLKEKSGGTEKEEKVVMAKAGTYGFGRKKKTGGAIPREKVAECCIEALSAPEASYKVVEIVTEKDSAIMEWSYKDLFKEIE